MAVLQPRVEDVHWASKNVGATEVFVRVARLGPDLVGAASSVDLGKAIVDPDSVLDGEGPEIDASVAWPAVS